MQLPICCGAVFLFQTTVRSELPLGYLTWNERIIDKVAVISLLECQRLNCRKKPEKQETMEPRPRAHLVIKYPHWVFQGKMWGRHIAACMNWFQLKAELRGRLPVFAVWSLKSCTYKTQIKRRVVNFLESPWKPWRLKSLTTVQGTVGFTLHIQKVDGQPVSGADHWCHFLWFLNYTFFHLFNQFFNALSTGFVICLLNDGHIVTLYQ